MCGIAGQFSFHNQVADLQTVSDMASALHHRGPDHQAVKSFGALCLAHTRLSLLDFSENGHQPFYNHRYSLVYNGEIYNFQKIRSEIESNFNVNFVSSTDTEVLFYSLIYFGVERTLKKIEGMFSFAFFDNEINKLYLVRDRLGIKPLFYSIKNDSVLFSSELKSIKNVVDVRVDHPMVIAGLSGHAERSRSRTLFQGIRQLTPGTTMVFDAAGNVECNVWFHPADLVDVAYYNELDKLSDHEVSKEFSLLFTNSVEKMLVADASIGAFVSGGIDSSLIAMEAKKLGASLQAYSVNVIGRHSEIEYAKKLVNEIGTQLHIYNFEPEMFLRDWVKTTWYNDAPVTINPHAVPFGNLTALAFQNGEKAVLTGEGADELFLGYPVHVRAAFDKAINSPWNWFNRLYSKIPGSQSLQQATKNKYLNQLNDMQLDYELLEDEHKINHSVMALPKSQHRLQAQSLKLLTTTLHALLWRNDRMGMMNSIESRFPFLDEAILKFAANLPVRHKVRRSWKFGDIRHPFHISKHVVRQAGIHGLSAELVKRKKYAFRVHTQSENSINADFFKNGFWQEFVGLSNKQLEFMCENTSNYILGNIASMDIWGRLNVHNESIEEVSGVVERNMVTELSKMQLSDNPN